MELGEKLLPGWADFTHGKQEIGFLLQPLTAAQFMNCRAMADRALGDGLLETVACGVSDWRGITKAGASVPFSPAGLRELFAPASRAALLAQVATAIMERSRITEDEEKK